MLVRTQDIQTSLKPYSPEETCRLTAGQSPAKKKASSVVTATGYRAVASKPLATIEALDTCPKIQNGVFSED